MGSLDVEDMFTNSQMLNQLAVIYCILCKLNVTDMRATSPPAFFQTLPFIFFFNFTVCIITSLPHKSLNSIYNTNVRQDDLCTVAVMCLKQKLDTRS